MYADRRFICCTVTPPLTQRDQLYLLFLVLSEFCFVAPLRPLYEESVAEYYVLATVLRSRTRTSRLAAVVV